MHIREGAQLEIFTESNGSVIFRKYSPVGELGDSAEDYAETLAKISGNSVAVVDKDRVIAAAGAVKKELLQREITSATENLIESRRLYQYKIGEERIPLCKDAEKIYIGLLNPILIEGDAIGALVMLVPETGKAPDETDAKITATAAQILCKQIEP